MFRLISTTDKDMANGMRNTSKTPLTEQEIEFVRAEIRSIGAEERIFIFNDPDHIATSTCYNFKKDVIYVTRNVFPDDKYGSTHPRDLMSVRAVLAHEYYGHRAYREEYLFDELQGEVFHTTPLWQDECRASITAAKTTPNLSERDRSNLVQDAIYRAKEYGHLIEMDDFMKEVVYGYVKGEKNICEDVGRIIYVSESSQIGVPQNGASECEMPDMPHPSRNHHNIKR